MLITKGMFIWDFWPNSERISGWINSSLPCISLRGGQSLFLLDYFKRSHHSWPFCCKWNLIQPWISQERFETPRNQVQIIKLTRYLNRSWLRDPKNHLFCSSDSSGFEKLYYAWEFERRARLGPCPGLYARCSQHDEAGCTRRLCFSDWRDTIGQGLCGDCISNCGDSAGVSISSPKHKRKRKKKNGTKKYQG